MAVPSKRHASSLDTTLMITVPKQQIIGMFSLHVIEAGCVHVLLPTAGSLYQIWQYCLEKAAIHKFRTTLYWTVLPAWDHNIDTRRRNNLYLPQANFNHLSKRSLLFGDKKILNNLPMEIKNVAGNLKNGFLKLGSVIRHELCTVLQNSLYWY